MNNRTRTAKRRRLLAVVAALAAFLASGAYWLADGGIVALPIAAATPVQGTSSLGGKTATFTPINAAVTIRSGAAQLANGYALGRITVAKGYGPGTKVDFAWTNPNAATAPLSSCSTPAHGTLTCSAWLTFGLYYPTHTGVCTSSDNAKAITVTDGSQYCLAPDTAASGRLSNASGQVLISKSFLSSFLAAGANDAGAAACTSTGTAWCTPSTAAANTNVFYIAASVSTSGGNPSGQQGQVSTLGFYFAASN